MSDSEALTQATESVGKLRDLRVEMASSSPALADIGGRYRQVLAAYSEIDF